MPLNSKCTEASFLPNSMEPLCLCVTQTPKYQDLAIFLWKMTTTELIYFTTCARVWGKNEYKVRGKREGDKWCRGKKNNQMSAPGEI